MKINSKLKVWDGIKHCWRFGTLLEIDDRSHYKIGIGEPHYFNYEEQWLSQSEFENVAKEFVLLDEEKAAQIHAQELPLALTMAQEAIAALLPGEKVEVIDGSLSAMGGALTLDPVTYEQETIGQFIERAGWQVTAWKYYHATREQPDEMVDSPIEEPKPYGAAVVLFVRQLFNMKASCYFEAKADEELAKMFEEEASIVF